MEKLGCYECGVLYGSDEWIETVVPTKFWFLISPTKDEGGVLCFRCMQRRFAYLGYGKKGVPPVPFRVYYPGGSMRSELYRGFDGDDNDTARKKWDEQFWESK